MTSYHTSIWATKEGSHLHKLGHAFSLIFQFKYRDIVSLEIIVGCLNKSFVMDVKDAFLICVVYFYYQRGGNGVNYLADGQQQVAFDAFTNNCLVL